MQRPPEGFTLYGITTKRASCGMVVGKDLARADGAAPWCVPDELGNDNPRIWASWRWFVGML